MQHFICTNWKTRTLFQGYFLSLLICEVLPIPLAKKDKKQFSLAYLFLGPPTLECNYIQTRVFQTYVGPFNIPAK